MNTPPRRRRQRKTAYSLQETLLLLMVDIGVLSSLLFTVVQWFRS
jgi:hypothetical protein